jgi:ribonuclease BN (tRNA processing enzyme)
MKVILHGTRGSTPISTGPDRVAEIQKSVWSAAKKSRESSFQKFKKKWESFPRSQFQIYGGATTCVEIVSAIAPHPIFIDAGSGLTLAAQKKRSGLNNHYFKNGKGTASFFFTHTHWDHILGITAIEQIFREGNVFHFYSHYSDIESRIGTLFDPKFFPVDFSVIKNRIQFHSLTPSKDISIGGLKFKNAQQIHPGDCLAYRIEEGAKSFVFATDTSPRQMIDQGLSRGSSLFSQCDVLVLDAHFSPEDQKGREDWGHGDIHSAVDLAVLESVKKLILFHQSPTYSDKQIDKQHSRALEYLRKKYGKGHSLKIEMAYDGMEFKV